MIEELLKIFSNYTRSLEILYLLNDVKSIVRIDANDNELIAITKFCLEKNLSIEVSDFKLSKIIDKNKGNYSNMAKKVPISSPQTGLFHIYISKDRNKARFLKIMENKNDDKAIGEILGYPHCCISFFLENMEEQLKVQNDYILPALENSKGFEFPFYNNYCARYFDMT